MRTERLHPEVGAEVTDFELRAELDDRSFGELESMFDRESLLLFRDQTFSEDEGRRFFARFGARVEGIAIVTNEAPTGRGELQFHSERSFQKKETIRGLALYCETISAGGGATLFIDCAAACRALPTDLRALLSHTDTVHSFDPRVRLGPEYAGSVPDGGWQTVHPAILEHPVTGVPILFVSPWFTTGIVGMDLEEGRALLTSVFDHLSNPAFRYRHEWQPRDLLLWDNLSIIHAREPYDEKKPRVLRKYEFRLRDHVRLPEPNNALA